MSISDRIDIALNDTLDTAIKDGNVSKILTVLTDEILKLAVKFSVKEQCEVINKAFGTDIKESAYRSSFYRNIKPLIDKKNNDFVEKSSRKNSSKKSSKTTSQVAPTTQKTEDKKVAPLELERNSLVDNLNKTFVRKTKPKFTKEDF